MTTMWHNPLSWSLEPPHSRLFMMFLVIVCLITGVRLARLALALFVARRRDRVSLEEVITQPIDADRLAKAALANALSGDGRSGAPARGAPDDVRGMLQLADAKFNYLWSMSHARVIATKGLVHLTLLVSLMVTCYGAYPAFEFEFNDTNVTGSVALVTATQIVLARLTLGLTVCIALCGVYLFVEGRLSRRQADWRLFHAAALDALRRERG
jgi:hypothetical protein